ncbi:MAG: hypothetical protein Q9226_001108 [Calogaya cf. arnoldii]
MSRPRNIDAPKLAGELHTGPGNDAPTAATAAHQIEAFSQLTKTDWYAKLEVVESKERTTADEKTQFIRWCEESTMEKGLSPAASSKRCWAKASFHVEGGYLYRNPSKSYSHRRKVISLPELFETVTEAHKSLGHAGQDATAKHILDQYFGISKKQITELVRHCAICKAKNQSKSGHSLSLDGSAPAGPIVPQQDELRCQATAASSTLDGLQDIVDSGNNNNNDNNRKRPRLSSEGNLNSSKVTKKSSHRTSKRNERAEIFAKLADSHMEIAGLFGRLRNLEPENEDEDDD